MPALRVLAVGTACVTSGCAAAGVPRRVVLRMVAPGVVELPRLVCLTCGGDLPFRWPEESDMPKITRHGGPSIAGEVGPEPKLAAPPAVEAPAVEAEPAPTETPKPVKAARKAVKSAGRRA